MTNSEKYLKDGVSVREFRNKLTEFFWDNLGLYEGNEEQIYTIIGNFLDIIEQPTLTEDERVILRNIKNDDYGKYIGRGSLSFKLYLRGNDESRAYAIGTLYNHLFKFIKERRRIFNKGVIRK